MFAGESVEVVMLAEKDLMTELVDWFGTDFRIMEDKDDMLKIRVRVNPEAMRFWALQYGPSVEILQPIKLRNQLKEDIEKMSKKYK